VWQAREACAPHPDRRRFEAFEYHPALRLGLGAACEYAMAVGIDRIAAQALLVRRRVHAALDDIPSVRALDPERSSALMTYRIDEALATQLLAQLTAAGIQASLITSQYARWALDARGLGVLLRLTPHYFTSDADIAHLRTVLAALPTPFHLPK